MSNPLLKFELNAEALSVYVEVRPGASAIELSEAVTLVGVAMENADSSWWGEAPSEDAPDAPDAVPAPPAVPRAQPRMRDFGPKVRALIAAFDGNERREFAALVAEGRTNRSTAGVIANANAVAATWGCPPIFNRDSGTVTRMWRPADAGPAATK